MLLSAYCGSDDQTFHDGLPSGGASPHGGSREVSAREREVLELVVDGYSNGEIGALLGISERTVQAHVASARRKLAARSRAHLAVRALQAGLVDFVRDEGE